jgi:hypothetical protein
MNLMDVVEKEFAVTNEYPKFIAGDTDVHYKIKEGTRKESSSSVVLLSRGAEAVILKHLQ